MFICGLINVVSFYSRFRITILGIHTSKKYRKNNILMSNTKENKQTNIFQFKRRYPRFKLHFSVQIEVVKQGDNPRRIEGRTIEVSRFGTTLECNEPVSIGVAVNLIMPFGGPYMAQVNGVWLDEEIGNYRLSTKLIDPPEWTAQNREFMQQHQIAESEQITLEPHTYYLLSSYKDYLQDAGKQERTLEQISQALIKKAVKFDAKFQKWMTQKIMEDLQSWEEESVNE